MLDVVSSDAPQAPLASRKPGLLTMRDGQSLTISLEATKFPGHGHETFPAQDRGMVEAGSGAGWTLIMMGA